MVDHLLMSIIYILSLILGGGFVWRFWRWWNRVKVTSPIVEGFYSLWGYTYEKVQQPFLEGLDFYITNNSGKAIRLTSIRWEMRQRPIPIFPPNRILYIDLATPVKGLKISPGEVKVVTFSNESLIESIAKPIEEFMKGKLDYSLRKPPSWSRVVVYHSDGKAASKFFPTLRIWSYLIDLATKRKWFVCKYIYNEAKQKGATFDRFRNQTFRCVP